MVIKIWEESLFCIYKKSVKSFVFICEKWEQNQVLLTYVYICTESCQKCHPNYWHDLWTSILRHQNYTARKQMFFWISPTHRSLLWGCWLCSIITDVEFAIYKQGGICGIWRFACGNYASPSTLMKNKSNVTTKKKKTRIVCDDVHHMCIVRTSEVTCTNDRYTKHLHNPIKHGQSL